MLCDFCQNKKGLVGATVDCGFYGETMVVPKHCAAQILTHEGWEKKAFEAKEKGDFERANLYFDRAIETQTIQIKTL